jgi:hypothetical protein
MTTMASEDNRAETEASDGEGTEPITSPEAQAQIAGNPSPLQATGIPAGPEGSTSAGPETKRGRPRRLQKERKNVNTKDSSALKKNTDAEAPASGLSDNDSNILLPLSSLKKALKKGSEWWEGHSRNNSQFDNSQFNNSLGVRVDEEVVFYDPFLEPQAAYIPRTSSRSYQAIEPPRRYQPDVTTVNEKSDVWEDTADGRSGIPGAAPDLAPIQPIVRRVADTAPIQPIGMEIFNAGYRNIFPENIYGRDPRNDVATWNMLFDAPFSTAVPGGPTVLAHDGIEVASFPGNSQTSMSQNQNPIAPSDETKSRDESITLEDSQISMSHNECPNPKKRRILSKFMPRKLLKGDASTDFPS